MGKLPSFPFYPGDWLRDSVAGCSLAAQGLWFRMLIVMHDGTPYGHLAKEGTALPPEVVARLCGTTPEQYGPLVAELDAALVPSRTAGGVIFNRRMVRDQRERDQAAARKRREREKDDPGPSRSCHADVTPMSQPSSSSSSVSDKTERGDAGATPILPDDGSGAIEAAMEAWSLASRGRGISATHNEHTPIRMALSSWKQEPPYGDVSWFAAVLRCIKAAQGSGNKFGDSPKYAIRIVNGLLAGWRAGSPPEPQASSVGGPRFVPDDDGAAGVEAGLRRAAERKAKAKQ